jgi:hypothetical protein
MENNGSTEIDRPSHLATYSTRFENLGILTDSPFSSIRTSVLQWYETHQLITLLDEASLKLNFNQPSGFFKKQQIVKRTFIEYLLGKKTHDEWISMYEETVLTYRRLTQRMIVQSFPKTQ